MASAILAQPVNKYVNCLAEIRIMSLNTLKADFTQRRNRADVGKICHAPFNNLYFGNRGYVMACCANKMHVLGKYPVQSVAEIWAGSKAQELRDAITQQDFNKGCQGCGVLYENGNYTAMPSTAYEDHPQDHPEWPRRLEFELSNTCNLECAMCTGEYSSSIRERREGKPPLENPYDKDFLEQLKPYIPYLHSARFVGGEPFLIELYYDIWELLIRLNPGITIYIQSNGTILNQRVKRVLENLKMSISVSIDSLQPETYRRIRVNGDLERTLKNISFFSSYCKTAGTNFSLSFCPMKNNWREIPDMVRFANSMNATLFYNSVYYPASLSLMNLPVGELVEIAAYLARAELLESSAIEKHNKQKYNDQQSEIRSYIKKANLENDVNKSDISLDDYLQRIENYIQKQPGMSALERDAKIDVVSLKLHEFIKLARQEDLEKETLRGLSDLSEDTIYQFLPDAQDISRSYQLFKERILKKD